MNNKFEAFDFYLLRIPKLSYNQIEKLNSSLSKEKLAKRLHQLYQSVEIQDAIYLASKELYHQMLRWVEGKDAGKIDHNLFLTLYKYAVRMGTRSTPFGMFAGVNMGNIGHKPSSIILTGGYSIHSRLDMNYTAEISNTLSTNSSIKESLSFYLNSSLYKTHDGYRFYEFKLEKQIRKYFLSFVKSTYYLELVIKAAKNGITHAKLIEALQKEDVPINMAKPYIDLLINSQILVSELEPTVTGDEFYGVLMNKLKHLDKKKQYLPALNHINDLLTSNESLVMLSESITTVIENRMPEVHSKHLLQVDLKIKAKDNQINCRTILQISKELNELLPLNSPRIPKELLEFKSRFLERYEDREIPLLEALDADLGIGYGVSPTDFHERNPLIKGLKLKSFDGSKKTGNSSYQNLLLNKFILSNKLDLFEVRLSKDDLRSLDIDKSNLEELPKSLYAIGNLIAKDCSLMDNGDFMFNLAACGGPSAIPLMTRFAQTEPSLEQKLADCVIAEESKDSILAEIIHLPESRTGNILQRPRLRNYEIPFLGMSSAPIDKQIHLTDLFVSVRSDKIFLRSKRLNIEVKPCLSCAHNYTNGITTYRFLSDLQYQQNSLSLSWDWGVLSDQVFLPRISYKHIVLSRARWFFQPSILEKWKNLLSAEEQKTFIEEYKLPQQVLIAEGDNELLIDFSSPVGMEVLINKLKKTNVVLYEFIFSNGKSVVKDKQGMDYLNELIIPFFSNVQKKPLISSPIQDADSFKINRSFSLGSEWIYVKIYCGIRQADKVLLDHLLPLIEMFSEDKVLSNFFFVRYNDPENHIRLRLQISDSSSSKGLDWVLQNLNKCLDNLFDKGIIYRIQYDTYNRELERYGKQTMEISESVFTNDSIAVFHILSNLNKKNIDSERWLFAVYGINQMLESFGLGLEEKLIFAIDFQKSFFKEFDGADNNLNYQLNEGYRRDKKALEDILSKETSKFSMSELAEIFDDRSQSLKRAYNELCNKFNEAADSNIQKEIILLLQSYCHMFLNRMFSVDQRLQELVIYHYLMKYYRTLAAKTNLLKTI